MIGSFLLGFFLGFMCNTNEKSKTEQAFSNKEEAGHTL